MEGLTAALFDVNTDLLSPAELVAVTCAFCTAALAAVLRLLQHLVLSSGTGDGWEPALATPERRTLPRPRSGTRLRISRSRDNLHARGLASSGSGNLLGGGGGGGESTLTLTALSLMHRGRHGAATNPRGQGGFCRVRSREDLLRKNSVEHHAAGGPGELTNVVRARLRAAAGGGCDFSGTWVVDKTRSASLDKHLEALGLPWIARKVACSATYKAEIRHQGLMWSETAVTALFRNTTELRLDGRTQPQKHPVDSTAAESSTTVRGDHVVTRMVYSKHPLVQVVDRWLEDNGQVYCARNLITLEKTGEKFDAVLYFKRCA